jgi:hypothetical protein
MNRTRRFLLLALALCVGIAIWLWWSRPVAVDMAGYAPADSLLYLEANEPYEIFNAVSATQAWRSLAQATGTPATEDKTHYLAGLMRWTGIGPARSVILSRAQVAVVVSELRVGEEGEALNIKHEGALLVETHTSASRIRSTVEETLKTLALQTYGSPTETRTVVDGIEFIAWSTPDKSRQIVGAISGSLVVVGTNQQIVQKCLGVAQGRGPSLKNDAELHTMRSRLEASQSLTFGYVPAANSAKLVAFGLPVLLGRSPGNPESQRLIANGATKIFGSFGWTSKPYLEGIQDRYAINLQPSVVSRLKPTFLSTGVESQLEQIAPSEVDAATSYRFSNTVATWQSFKSAVSSQVDALSAILFSSLLESGLLSYGIEQPETFLSAVSGELVTMRLDDSSERSIMIAHVRDRAKLRELFARKMTVRPSDIRAANTEFFEDSEGESAASLGDHLVVLGSPIDVRRYFEIGGPGNPMNAEDLKRMKFFASPDKSAPIITYASDAERVRKFALTVFSAKVVDSSSAQQLEQAINALPSSVTETSLSEQGIERLTRSPLGQFSSIVPSLFPEKARLPVLPRNP